MSENRKPNTQCLHCQKPIYRRPNELSQGNRVFCSRVCFNNNLNRGLPKPPCLFCNEQFEREHKRQKFCSRKCANNARYGMKYSKSTSGNKSQQRLRLLQNSFLFDSCMVEGCDYNKTFDIHRYIPGSQGGKYELGNMFAICPNHHAEVTRKLIDFEKISDCKLKIKE